MGTRSVRVRVYPRAARRQRPLSTDSSTALVPASRHDVKEPLTRLGSWFGGLPIDGISAYLIPVAFILALLLALTLIGHRCVSGRDRRVGRALVRPAILSGHHTRMDSSAIEYSR
jgi:hypothetical protein